MTTREKIREILLSPEWTEAEKSVIHWQFRLHGNFYRQLWVTIVAADDANLLRIERGFPTEVRGFRMWHSGDLAQRFRAAGLDI